MSESGIHEAGDIARIFEGFIRYRNKYAGQLIVLKFGGALAETRESIANIATQVDLLRSSLRAQVVVVHGGGKQIDLQLEKNNIQIKKDAAGLRITDERSLEISDQSLRALNGQIVSTFNSVAQNVRAVGMAGYEAQMISAHKRSAEVPNNYTGHVDGIDTAYLRHLLSYKQGDIVPVIYPICYDATSKTGENRLNVNADEVAGKLAAALDARRLILCSDIPGVLDRQGKLISQMSVEEIDDAINSGMVTGGMIQKLRTAAHAAESLPSGSAVIVDGRTLTSILVEILHEKGCGTLISKAENIALESPKP